jgi:hypothetical protein
MSYDSMLDPYPRYKLMIKKLYTEYTYGRWIMRKGKDYCPDCAEKLGLLKAK